MPGRASCQLVCVAQRKALLLIGFQGPGTSRLSKDCQRVLIPSLLVQLKCQEF